MKRFLILTMVLVLSTFYGQNKNDAAIPQKASSKSETAIKKVLIIVSNANSIGPNNRRTGTFLPEVAHPYAEFARANYQIDFASLNGDTPYLDALNLANDADNLAFFDRKRVAGNAKSHKALQC